MKDCKACAHASETYRCPVCGMTGSEIAEARKAEETGQYPLF